MRALEEETGCCADGCSDHVAFLRGYVRQHRAATSDAFVTNVNKLLLSNYGNILGPNAAVVDVLTSPPYYQLVYQTLQYNYTFTVLYDYLQGRIIQATASSAKITAM